MRGTLGAGLVLAFAATGIGMGILGGCGQEPVRALRAFDGAPPVIPHEPYGAPCTSCHAPSGPEVPGVGFAPRSPHGETAGMQFARCRQCHVFQRVTAAWRATTFEGLSRHWAPGGKAHPLAPPVIPHPIFMREDCLACHDGPAARDNIRTSHPERSRCRQCHVEQTTTGRFLEPSTR